MSTESAPARNPQADEMIAAVRKLTVSNTALAAAVGALTIAVTQLEQTIAADVEETEHDDDCEDDECDGECLDEPEPAPRRKRKR